MLQSNRKGGPRVGSTRPETRPFVQETLPIRGQGVSMEGVPSHARGTPLPKPAVDLSAKKSKRESSLLGLVVPKLGRKREGRAPAPPSARSTAPMYRPDPTLEVSQSDMLLDSSTQELELTDLSQVDLPQRDDPSMSLPPIAGLTTSRRKHGPWVVWGLVGGAWCVMIALALLAVDDSSKSAMRADAATRVTHEQAAMAAVTAREPAPSDAPAPSLATTQATAQPVQAESEKMAQEAPVGALNPATAALGEEEKNAASPAEEATSTPKRATVKKHKRKHGKAQFQKRHKGKKSRHHKHRAKAKRG